VRRELLIGAGPGEWRAAWLEDGVAVELYVERGELRPVGSIHLGRVVRRVGGLAAALVDIGEERPGFLPVRASETQRLDEGARVLVQVQREAQRDKGARLSTRLARHGTPFAPDSLAARAAILEPPAQLDPAPGFAAALALRLPASPDRVVIDDPAPLPELRAVFPEPDIAHQPVDLWPIDLDGVFAAALAPSSPLPDHGRIHIDECRAAVLIDVDTGTPEGGGSAPQAALAANLAAAAAVAHAIRLRQLGGGIIVDFIGLEGRGPRDRVRDVLAAALADDPARPELLGWTRLGHLEIVRPRHGRPLSAAMLEPGAARKSTTALAFEALRALYREARAHPAANWRLVVVPAIEAALRGPQAAALRELETRLGRTIALARMSPGEAAPFDIVAL
jgi:ribonuclease G